MFDWLSRIFHTIIPDIPAPFTWVSTYIRLHVWDPVKRTFAESENANDLLAGEIRALYANRGWYTDRLRTKIMHAYTLAKADLDAAVAVLGHDITNITKAWGDALRADYRSLTASAQALAQKAWDTLYAWINGTFGPFVTYVNTQIALFKAGLATVASFTKDTVDYWVTIYQAYRVELAALMADPPGYILALIEHQLGLYLDRVSRLGATILDQLWG